MPRVRRKETIFRLYLFTLVVLCSLGVFWVLSMQARYHRSQVQALEKSVSELRTLLDAVQSSVSSPPSSDSTSASSSPVNPLVARAQQERERLFWIEGNGFNKRYAYLDLCFRDGYRARYYFRPWPSRGELVTLHRRIEHDALSHYYDPVESFDSDFDSQI